MKYLFINSVYGFGSTGRIIADKCEQLKNEAMNVLLHMEEHVQITVRHN